MEPQQPSTSKDATARDDDGPAPIDGVREALASTADGSIPVQQQQLRKNVLLYGPVSLEQCQQLFGATCRLKLQRCQFPAPSTPVVSAPIPADDASGAPKDSRTVRKVEEESDLTGSSSSSSEDDEVKVLPVPPAAPSTNKKKTGRKVAHGKSPSVQCTVCKKPLSSKRSLTIHMRKHTGEKRYRCENCGRSFWNPNTFWNHKKANKGRNGVCPRVNKTDRWKPKGPWTCKICGKRLKQPGYYVAHMRSHRQGERDKPFKCADCGNAFRKKADLSIHRRIHTGVWTYSCVFCDKGFHQTGNFWIHLRGHTEEKPYFCGEDGCGKSFRFHESFKRHLRLIHLKKY